MSDKLTTQQSNQRMDLFKQTLKLNIPRLKATLPKGTDTQRLLGMAMNACVRNQDLLLCNADSFLLAVINTAELGLDPGVSQHVAFVPYKGIIQMQVMYQGLLELVFRSNEVSWVDVHEVFPEDKFDYGFGSDPFVTHTPAKTRKKDTKWTHVYATAKLKDGSVKIAVMDRDEVMAIKASSPAAKSDYSPWKNWEIAMAKKTVLKLLCKTLRKSVLVSHAVALDNAADRGERQVPMSQVDLILSPIEPDPEKDKKPDGEPPASRTDAVADEVPELPDGPAPAGKPGKPGKAGALPGMDQ